MTTAASQDHQTLLVTGASGFIGSHVIAESRRLGRPALGISRHNPTSQSTSHVALDVRDTARLIAAARNVNATAIVHAASYVGTNPALARATNIDGTKSVLAAAFALGKLPVVYVSTASVVGMGPHTHRRARRGDRAPVSIASETRAEAESLVESYGGVVVRPDLVYGPGDRWFVPTLANLLTSSPGSLREWSGLASTVHVRDLARALAALAVSRDPWWQGRTIFVNAPEPSLMADVGSTIQNELHWLATTEALLAATNRSTTLTEHQRSLLTVDHWYDEEETWKHLRLSPPRAFQLSIIDVHWYDQFIEGASGTNGGSALTGGSWLGPP